MLALLGSLKKAGVTPPPDPNLITNSLRFRRAASANLTRTFGTPTNASVYTWSGWVKRGLVPVPTSTQSLFSATNTSFQFFTSSFEERLSLILNGTTAITTTAIFRDTSAWYHIVYAQNEATQTIYVNGDVVGTGTTANTVFNTAIAHQLGGNTISPTNNYFDGYLTEVNFIDGQALTPTSFGEINSTTGVWSPKQYTGTYGNNGFRLRFNSTSSLPALTADSSGNNNNWTATNVSLTSGVTYDSMIDVPVNYSDSGNGRGNYAVLDFLNPATTATLSSGNLQTTSVAAQNIIGSMSMDSGSWYWEIAYSAATESQLVGVYKTAATTASITPTTNVIGLRFNADTGELDYTVDGSAYISIATGLTGGGYFPYAGSLTNAKIIYANFGQRPFAYTRPVGFNALNTNNLANPVIVNPANYIAATIYTGTANALSVLNNTNGVSFQPNLVWIKNRASANHALFDSIRGATNYISSNTTAIQVANATTLTSFTANGFDLGTNTTLVNALNNNYVAWQWRKSVTSGMDIVSYTGTGANNTIAHNLNAVPAMIIIKQLTGSTSNWQVYHTSIPATDSIQLNLTNPAAPNSTVWNNTAPTSSSFSIGSSSDVNSLNENYIAYCFSEISNFSKFGIYQGNGSSNGPIVNCNFTPKIVLVKRLDSGAEHWYLYDSSRQINTRRSLRPSAIFTEDSTGVVDIYSNKFKIRTNFFPNTTGGSYIFAAFAETPFKYALAKF
jgi:hypothetical protein